MRRGEIWWAELPQPEGTRPVLVISSDDYNASRLGTVIVAMMTGNLKRTDEPGNVEVSAAASGLPRDSVINVSTIAAIDRDYLRESVGRLPAPLMQKVNDGLRLALAL